MRLARFLVGDRPVPAILDAEDRGRDVSGLCADFTPETLGPDLLSRLAGCDRSALPVVGGPRLPPLSRPRTIWCIGRNYAAHAAETGSEVPSEPMLFSKGTAAFSGPDDPIPKSPEMTKLDWEVELGVVIGTPALRVPRARALDHVLGYTIVNDVSERTWQKDRGGQFIKGKSFPGFCPTGPFIATADEIADPQALDLWLDLNGTRMQAASTAEMIFDVATLISHISQFALLEAGDLICTGTPSGVGLGQTPPRFLQAGDEIRLGITGLGTQTQQVQALQEADR